MQTDFNIVQIAYHVPDIERAAHAAVTTYGAGPFFVLKHIELAQGVHRGKECRFVHSSAYGQWGGVMLEFVQQDSSGPSPFRDLYAAHQSGLHHVAVMVGQLEQAYQHFAAQDIHLATQATTVGGTEFAFLDGIGRYGHFIEVYESSQVLLEFYERVRQASVGWTRQDPVRDL